MTLNEFIEDAFNVEHEFLMEAVQDLTPEELRWRPGLEANPIGWMLWHMIQRKLEIWERDGWHEKFGLPTQDNGFGHTPEQVAQFPDLDLAELLRYGEAVRARTFEYLKGLTPEDFEVVPREQRPEMSVGAIFRQVVGEIYQHQGHILYLKGLLRDG